MLSAFKQIAVQIEAQEGVHETGEAAGDLLTVRDLEWVPDFERYEPETVQLSLSPTPDRASRTSGTIRFKVELAGAAAGLTTSPPFERVMRACGFRSLGDQTEAAAPFTGTGQKGRVFYVVADAAWTTGTQLDHGTAVTDGATGAGVVIGTYMEGTATQKIWIRSTGTGAFADDGTITATGIAIDYTGSPVLAGRALHPIDKPTYYLKGALTGTIAAGDVVSGVTSGAKALVIETNADGGDLELLVERAPGFGFFSAGETVRRAASNEIASIQAPVQFDIPTLSITYYEDGNRVRLGGCRGTAKVMFENGKPALLDVEMMGLHDSETSTAMFPPAAAIEATPPTFFGAVFTIDETFHPLISAYNVDLGRQTSRRSDVEKTNGYGFTASHNRRIVGDLDPETVHESIFPSIGKSRQAVGIVIRTSYGTGGTGNAFEAYAPNVQFTLAPAERDGQSTYNKSLKFFPKAGIRGDEFCLFSY